VDQVETSPVIAKAEVKQPRLLIEEWLLAAAIGVECVRVALPTGRAANRGTRLDDAEESRAVSRSPFCDMTKESNS
jgi:hypothetical protein